MLYVLQHARPRHNRCCPTGNYTNSSSTRAPATQPANPNATFSHQTSKQTASRRFQAFAKQVLDKPSRRFRISGYFFQNSSPIFDNIQLSQLDNIFFTILIKTIDKTTSISIKSYRQPGARPPFGLAIAVSVAIFPFSRNADASSGLLMRVQAQRQTRRLIRQRKT